MMEVHILFLLLIKHTIADLGLQSTWMWGRAHEKKNWPFGGQQHYLHHSVLTFIVMILFVDFTTAITFALLDHLAHWHIDFGKHHLNTYLGVTRKDIVWWWTTVADQLLHFLTYYLLIIYLL